MQETISPIQTGVNVIKEYLKTLPEQPGVYRMLSEDEQVLYVGKARRLKQRVVNYTRPDPLPLRLQRMISETRKMEFIITQSESEALLLESNLIKKLQPRYNVLLKDDKAYPYILLSKEGEIAQDFPQIMHHRGKRIQKGEYFGPFASAGMVYSTMNVLQRAFLLRNCSDSYFSNRKRPCMQFEIKRCSAPCVNFIDKQDYNKLVRQAGQFLKGKATGLQQELAGQMEEASKHQKYERAGILRDRIRALTEIQARQHVNIPGMNDVDVIALASEGDDAGRTCIQLFVYRSGQNYGNRAFFPKQTRGVSPAEILNATLSQYYAGKPIPKDILLNMEPDDYAALQKSLSESAGHTVTMHVPQRGEKYGVVQHAETNAEAALARRLAEGSAQRKLLEGVQKAFGLEALPQRVEVYDNSHIQGAHAVGAYIVAGEEGFMKRHYRRYNVDAIKVKGDDYAMMREVIRRRGQRVLKDKIRPDLIILDGGKGQLSVALDELDKLELGDLNVFAIAKGEDRNAGRERFFTRHHGQESIDEFALSFDDPVLYYLQRLRDEAHRFAITSHRDKRQRAMGKNPLDEIPGIGATRKKALLNHFGSARGVKAASIDDLTNVPGISKTVAEGIYNFFYGG